MGSTIPQLTLFPLYPGGPQVKYNSTYGASALNGNSSFTLPATQFTPAYAVNQPGTGNAANSGKFLSIGPGGTLTSKPVGSASAFDQNLGVDGLVLGNLKKIPVPAVAPVVPDIYKALTDLYKITDANFTDLMSQASFSIPNIGLGLKVTTDGAGGIDSVAINPSSRGALPGVSPFNTATFNGPDRVAITSGATFKAIPDSGLGGSLQNTPAPVQTKPIQPQPQLNINPFHDLKLNQPERNAGIFTVGKLGESKATEQSDSLRNLLLQRLNQLQAPEQGLTVAGFDAAVNSQQARQVAASQAGFDVFTSGQFKDNVANLTSGASKQASDSYSATFNPKTMDGRIPMAPSLPQGSPNQGQLSFNMGGGLDMGNAAADAMNKRSSGGYIPFHMQNNSAGTGAQGGFANPFSSGGQQHGSASAFGGQAGRQQQQPRRPLAFIA